jgi:hypothetical protein
MECPICTFEFDAKTRKPLICICGNSICEECVTLIVVKSGNNFVCPLCKYTLKNIKDLGLGVNKTLLKLVLDLEALQFPLRESSMLTEKLITKDIETQFSPEFGVKKYNEYINVYGVFGFALLFLPWV